MEELIGDAGENPKCCLDFWLLTPGEVAERGFVVYRRPNGDRMISEGTFIQLVEQEGERPDYRVQTDEGNVMRIVAVESDENVLLGSQRGGQIVSEYHRTKAWTQGTDTPDLGFRKAGQLVTQNSVAAVVAPLGHPPQRPPHLGEVACHQVRECRRLHHGHAKHRVSGEFRQPTEAVTLEPSALLEPRIHSLDTRSGRVFGLPLLRAVGERRITLVRWRQVRRVQRAVYEHGQQRARVEACAFRLPRPAVALVPEPVWRDYGVRLARAQLAFPASVALPA